MARDGAQTKLKALRAAIRCVAELGIEATTFQAIADEAKLSQPLVVYHFKNRKNIFPAIVEHLLVESLVETESALTKTSATSRELLAEYLRVSFSFFRSQPELAKVYLTFYYLSGVDRYFTVLNDKLKSEAAQRIHQILARGVQSGELKDASPLTARMIHLYLTGVLLNLATEKSSPAQDEVLLKELEAHCFKIAGF